MERLGAVAGLEQERPAGGDLRERGLHLARLAGEDERRQRAQRPPHLVGARVVGPLRLLERLELPPRRRGPGGTHGCHVNQCRHRARQTAKLGAVRIFSGIQPTGAKHFGNYSGGFRQYAATQEQGDAFFCIVDLHSITVDYDPADLRERTLDLAALLFATGLDPERSTVFAQSHVTAHAEAAWLLSAVASYGQLGRMTQFKEKGDRQEFVSAGLFTYPVLMAGDILLYQTDIVPIGDDQRQHLELARDIAERFNSRFGETFRVPDGVFPTVGARIMDLQEPTKKMSTTGGTPQGTVLLLDPPDVIRKKFKSAVTDSGREVRRGDDKPGVTNLIDIMTVATGATRRGDRGPLRRRRLRRVQGGRRRGGGRAARADPGALRRAARRRGRARAAARGGADKAREASAPTLRAMYERMGFVLLV